MANGKLIVVGLGPGGAHDMSRRARTAVESCDLIAGYTVYVDGRQSGFKVGRGEGEAVSETEEFILVSTELKGFRKNAAPDPEVKTAHAAGDEFVVDFVRVYDIVD